MFAAAYMSIVMIGLTATLLSFMVWMRKPVYPEYYQPQGKVLPRARQIRMSIDLNRIREQIRHQRGGYSEKAKATRDMLDANGNIACEEVFRGEWCRFLALMALIANSFSFDIHIRQFKTQQQSGKDGNDNDSLVSTC